VTTRSPRVRRRGDHYPRRRGCSRTPWSEWSGCAAMRWSSWGATRCRRARQSRPRRPRPPRCSWALWRGRRRRRRRRAVPRQEGAATTDRGADRGRARRRRRRLHQTVFAAAPPRRTGPGWRPTKRPGPFDTTRLTPSAPGRRPPPSASRCPPRVRVGPCRVPEAGEARWQRRRWLTGTGAEAPKDRHPGQIRSNVKTDGLAAVAQPRRCQGPPGRAAPAGDTTRRATQAGRSARPPMRWRICARPRAAKAEKHNAAPILRQRRSVGGPKPRQCDRQPQTFRPPDPFPSAGS
jgi:hypothetical protein